MPDSYIRLEVWKPASPSKKLSYEDEQDGNNSVIPLKDENLHEQVYSWKIKGDPWIALADDEKATTIKESVTTGFSFEMSPKNRSIIKLKVVVEKIIEYLQEENNRKWQSWEESFSEEDDFERYYQVQPILSLYHHLKWLCDVFQDVPGASVTIR